MKIKFIAFGLLLLTISGCKDCKKDIDLLKNELTKTQIELEKCHSKKAALEQKNNIQFQYVPKQRIKEMNPSELAKKYKSFELSNIKSNKFKTNKNHIDLSIPVSNDTFKIIDVINVSNDIINAIIVLLDDDYRLSTINSTTTHFLKSKPKIDKITGLTSGNLNRDKNLVVYVIHDNEFSDCIKQVVIDCVNSLGSTYPNPNHEITCSIADRCLDKAVPREIKGDIITGD